MQSSGNAPYHFWWIGEDFSGAPFAHTPAVDLFETTLDVWRAADQRSRQAAKAKLNSL